ncbi:hypothetical protein GF376_02400, partial [Candidatus Peregrinibacteria bacterium]|nr:hypothetical protein [Candidatus Peregrinibacteria bacterium]
MKYIFLILLLLVAGKAQAQTKSGKYSDFSFDEIPIGNFYERSQLPLREYYRTQEYNNPKSGGWCFHQNNQYSATSESCNQHKIYFGHDGVDLTVPGSRLGQEAVFSIQNGLVVASISM